MASTRDFLKSSKNKATPLSSIPKTKRMNGISCPNQCLERSFKTYRRENNGQIIFFEREKHLQGIPSILKTAIKNIEEKERGLTGSVNSQMQACAKEIPKLSIFNLQPKHSQAKVSFISGKRGADQQWLLAKEPCLHRQSY